MAKFLRWVDTKAVGQGELAVMAKLEEIRGADPLHPGASFTTIAGRWLQRRHRALPLVAGDREGCREGHLPAHRFRRAISRRATDITRTIAVGSVPKRLKEHYTRVLKGHIAVATARFPKGTGGIAIDGFARRALWQAGLDFDHGTGHGVGVYLGVPRGPGRISPLSQVPLEPA